MCVSLSITLHIYQHTSHKLSLPGEQQVMCTEEGNLSNRACLFIDLSKFVDDSWTCSANSSRALTWTTALKDSDLLALLIKVGSQRGLASMQASSSAGDRHMCVSVCVLNCVFLIYLKQENILNMLIENMEPYDIELEVVSPNPREVAA